MILFKFYHKWHWPTCFKSVRNWRERFSRQNVLGAPITDDKIRYFIRKKYRFPSGILMKLRYHRPRKTNFSYSPTSMRIRNAFLHTRMNLTGIKPQVPARKYLITLVNLPDSCEAAKQCITSAKLYGEDNNLEFFPAIDRFQAKRFFIQHQLSWISRGKENIRTAAMGCLASHFSLWLKAIESNETIMILEHDFSFVSEIPAMKFKHIVVLSSPSGCWNTQNKEASVQKNRENYYPFSYLQGSGAYAITPEGAKLLVEDAQNGATFAADSFIRRSIVDIVDYQPSPCSPQNSHFSSIQTTSDQSREMMATTIWDKYTNKS